ncbi:MAG: 4-(cytidine 5'-diphospho)-2-C-methyl-D-erythritol kinase [Bacillota bacterium]|jgi:4-diphosphocytidyl-2-C-methyl-D-erythritol kinase
MTTILQAPAKINLALDVVGKKDNGYHLLEMIMQTISLYDEVRVSPAKKTTIKCSNPQVPAGENNICIKAWRLMQQQFNLPGGIEITIKKNIPIAAGLAGGSTNGAAVLLAVNREFDLGLSLKQLQNTGVKLGADVPFCLQKGTALATGIGDRLTALPSCPPIYVLAVNAGFPVSTVQVYKNLVWHKINKHPNIKNIIKAIRNGNVEQILNNTENVLENSAFQIFPQLAAIKKQIDSLGVFPMMSGSGGTMLGLTGDREKAEYALRQIKGEFPFAGIYETR